MRFPTSIALRKLDALKAIVANHAAPNRVIEIENQRLAALAAQRANDARDVIGVKRDQFVREGELAQIPQLRIVPIGQANRLGQRRHIEQHVARPGDRGSQCAVDAIEDVAQRSR